METQKIKASAVWVDVQKCEVAKIAKTKEIHVIEKEDKLFVITGRVHPVLKNGCKIETDDNGNLYLNNQKTIFQLR